MLLLAPRVAHLPRCENGLIFTGARQGSTWLIDSFEKCMYSSSASPVSGLSFSRDVFRRTELWKHFGEPHLDGTNLTARDALRYITHNTSVKIFPSVFWRRRNDITYMLKRRADYNLTVIVLRRDVQAAWKSWVRARENDVWNGASSNEVRGGGVNESLKSYFEQSRLRYDRGVDMLLGKLDVQFDLFDYDVVRKLRSVVATNNGCVIRNCNFVTN